MSTDSSTGGASGDGRLESGTPEQLERFAQEADWRAHVVEAHSRGACEFSGLGVTECVQSICDCFETLEGAARIEAEAASGQATLPPDTDDTDGPAASST